MDYFYSRVLIRGNLIRRFQHGGFLTRWGSNPVSSITMGYNPWVLKRRVLIRRILKHCVLIRLASCNKKLDFPNQCSVHLQSLKVMLFILFCFEPNKFLCGLDGSSFKPSEIGSLSKDDVLSPFRRGKNAPCFSRTFFRHSSVRVFRNKSSRSVASLIKCSVRCLEDQCYSSSTH